MQYSKMRRPSKTGSSIAKTSSLQKQFVRGALLIVAVTLLIIFIFGDHGLYHLYTLKSERKRIQAEIDYLRNQRITLEDEKTRLKTDYKYIEEMAREKYRMAKKREKVFKVIEKKED